jgi:deoxyadenosine/deoxycytidine kinase
MEMTGRNRKIVAVCGMPGSGKTTLATALTRQFNWEYVSESETAHRYLEHLHTDPGRWAFECQVSFLAGKAVQLSKVADRGRTIVIDRSFREDREVFAEHFRRSGFIDPRSFDTYELVYKGLSVPEPDLYLICCADIDTVAARAESRRYGSVRLSKEFIQMIYARYVAFYKQLPAGRSLYANSQQWDWREDAVAMRIGNEVERQLNADGGNEIVDGRMGKRILQSSFLGKPWH